MNAYELVTIGTGMGGGTLAYSLRHSGRKILLLERGDFLPSEVHAKSEEDVSCARPSSSAVNPALTITTQALRVADHIGSSLSGRSQN